MVSAGELYPMTALEIARGVCLDDLPPRPAPCPDRGAEAAGPRAVLEAVLAGALASTPCVVAFSGGRDSSALLAVATHVARREGMDDPLPATRRFPGLPETDESEWQERVVRHLRLREWERVDLDDVQLDLVGPVAAARLRRYGVVWPPMLHADVPLLALARGGTLVDGEGGDQALGEGLHRIEPLARLVARRRPVTVRNLARAVAVAAPRPARRRLAARHARGIDATWLRPHERDRLVRDIAREIAGWPLRWDHSVRALPYHRVRRESLHNREVLAAAAEVGYLHPFLDPAFLDALAHVGGATGLGSRTSAMRHLVGDLLPDAVLARPGKASFNRSILGGPSRAFARDWDGTGVDLDLVDPDALRLAWLDEWPNGRAFSLLQSAWLASAHGDR